MGDDDDDDDDDDVPGYKGTVLGSKGAEAEVVEVPLQVYDVVPKARGAKDDQ